MEELRKSVYWKSCTRTQAKQANELKIYRNDTIDQQGNSIKTTIASKTTKHQKKQWIEALANEKRQREEQKKLAKQALTRTS